MVGGGRLGRFGQGEDGERQLPGTARVRRDGRIWDALAERVGLLKPRRGGGRQSPKTAWLS